MKLVHVIGVYAGEQDEHFYIKNGIVQTPFDEIPIMVVKKSLPFVWYGTERVRCMCVWGGGVGGGVYMVTSCSPSLLNSPTVPPLTWDCPTVATLSGLLQLLLVSSPVHSNSHNSRLG